MKVNQLHSASIYTNNVVSTAQRTVSSDSKATAVLGPIVTFKMTNQSKLSIGLLSVSYSDLINWDNKL